MRTVDEILAAADGEALAESELKLPRYPRVRQIDTVRELSTVSGIRTSLYLGLQWSIIIATLWTVGYFQHWALYVPAAFIVASRMQALGVLLHDGVHYLLYRNRDVNDIVCDLLIAFPLGMSTTLYRRTHFRHHRFTNTEEDQDLAAQKQEHEWFAWPKSRWACVWTVIRSVLGINFYRGWILYKHWSPWNNFRSPHFPRRARVLYLASTVAVYALFAWGIRSAPAAVIPLLVLYALSGLTLLNLINRIRATAEHLGTENSHELNATRTVLPSFWERLLIAPYGVNYHLEHHLFPSVPGWNLPKLHGKLMEDPEFRETAHITSTYVGVIRELMQQEQQVESD